MVKIAVAGGSSSLALEVIDKLVEGQQHQVIALVRRDSAQFPQQPNVQWVTVSYNDKAELVQVFRGVDVVLNFIAVNDPDNAIGKILIDAAVEAGVKRFAPSEWAMGQKLHDVITSVPWYYGKLAIQAYLRKINEEKKVLEYCLFQPGIFLEYIGFPHQATKHVPTVSTMIQLNDLRIVSVKGHEDDPVVLTSVADIATVVRRAVEYEGEWPEVGGISGNRLSARQIKELTEKIRGKPVQLDLVEEADLAAGVLKVDMPPMGHPSIPEEQKKAWHVPFWAGMLSATAKGANRVSVEWNRILPDHKFETVEDYVKKVWGDN